MKTLKRIIMNLILVLALTILMSGLVIGDSNAIKINRVDSIDHIILDKSLKEYEIIEVKNGIEAVLKIYDGNTLKGYIVHVGGNNYSVADSTGGRLIVINGDVNDIDISGITNGDNLDNYQIGFSSNGKEEKIAVGNKPISNFNWDSLNYTIGGDANSEYYISLNKTMDELKNAGCTSIVVKSQNSSANEPKIKNPSGSGKTISLGTNPDVFTVEFYVDGLTAPRKTFTDIRTIDNTGFGANIILDGIDYKLELSQSQTELTAKNSGRQVSVKITLEDKTDATFNLSVSSNSKIIDINSKLPNLNKNEKATVVFYDKDTKRTIATCNVAIPELSLGEISAIITGPGTVELRSKDGKGISMAEVAKVLGFSNVSSDFSASVSLKCGDILLGTVVNSSGTIMFEQIFLFGRDLSGLNIKSGDSFNGLYTIGNEQLQNYFERVQKNGDQPLTLEITKRRSNGISRYFETKR